MCLLQLNWNRPGAENHLALISQAIILAAGFGKRMHLFEAGLGSTIHLRINDPFYEFCIYPILGYRLQPVKSRKVMFKIYTSIPYNLNYQTYINLKDSEVFFIPLGISIGKSF